MPELYQLKIVATGEVRDAEGNLIESFPVEETVELTEEQVEALAEAAAEKEES